MKAARFYDTKDVRVENVEKPKVINDDEVLIKVVYAGICGSDLHIYNKAMFVTETPMTMGHEFSGTVEEVGTKVESIQVGDNVTADPRVTCVKCTWCQIGKEHLCPDLAFIGEVTPGSFAEYIVLKEEKVFVLPPEIDLVNGCLVEPLAVALHIANQGKFSERTRLGIVGAGPIGLITAILAKEVYQVEEVNVLDISTQRLELAKKNGIHNIFDSLPSFNVNTVVDAAGGEGAFKSSLNWVEPEGTMVLAGIYEEEINIDPNEILIKELTLTGVHGYTTQEISETIKLFKSQNLDLSGLVKIMPLGEAKEAFEALLQREKSIIKLLLKP